MNWFFYLFTVIDDIEGGKEITESEFNSIYGIVVNHPMVKFTPLGGAGYKQTA